MSTEVAIRSSEVPASFAEQMHMATVLADSSLLPAHLRGKPANVLLILQGARALDVSAFWALQSMHVVEGKLGLSAELMRALVNKAGHQFTVIERTDKRAKVRIQRKDKEEPYEAEFTVEDARAAELLGKGNWKKYLKSMLVARATSIAVRDECPEVMFGMVYTPEELGADTDREGNPVYSQDGRVVMDGAVIEKPTTEQRDAMRNRLAEVTLEALPALWAEIKDKGWAFELMAEAEGYDASFADGVAQRLAEFAAAARCRPEVRNIFNLAKVMSLLDYTVLVWPEPGVYENGVQRTLREAIVARGNEVPEECPSDEQGATPAAAGEPGEGDAAPEPQEAAQRAEEIATPNAEALRAAAAESWGEDDATAQAAGPVYVGEIVEEGR